MLHGIFRFHKRYSVLPNRSSKPDTLHFFKKHFSHREGVFFIFYYPCFFIVKYSLEFFGLFFFTYVAKNKKVPGFNLLSQITCVNGRSFF